MYPKGICVRVNVPGSIDGSVHCTIFYNSQPLEKNPNVHKPIESVQTLLYPPVLKNDKFCFYNFFTYRLGISVEFYPYFAEHQ